MNILRPNPRKHKCRLPYTALIIAVLCLALCAVLPEILSPLFPDAVWLKPIRRSCESSGIRLKVLSTEAEGCQGSILLELNDLQKNRLNRDILIHSGWNTASDYEAIANCGIYDPDLYSSSPTLILDIMRMDERSLAGRKVSFQLNHIVAGSPVYLNQMDVSPDQAAPHPATCSGIKIRSWGWSDEKYAGYKPETFLVPGEIYTLSDDIHITALGFVDGLLRIQTHYSDAFAAGIHGRINLRHKNGDALMPILEMDYWDEAGTGLYTERCFDVAADALDDYYFYCFYYPEDQIISGDWEITVPLI